MSKDSLPFHTPDISEDDIQAVVETLKSGWLTTGPKVKQFEADFAAVVEADHAIALNSCTAALHLALIAAGVTAGDEVIIPTMTFAATGEVVTYVNAKPVLIDSQPDTLNMDPDLIERSITSRTKAIIPVHYGGQPCEMDRIMEIARHYNLTVIEDAAHALPARYRGKLVGAIGNFTCFSFYATKTITTGEGGMVTTQRSEDADHVRTLSLHGISKDAWKRYTSEGSWYYEIQRQGFKYNMTDVAAALGIQQLKRCDQFWESRKRIVELYRAGFADIDELTLPVCRDHLDHAWHLYAVQLHLEQLSITRNIFIEELKSARIGTSVHFIPLHLHPYYRNMYKYQRESFPIAALAYERLLSLPIYPKMSSEDVEYVIEQVRRLIIRYRR